MFRSLGVRRELSISESSFRKKAFFSFFFFASFPCKTLNTRRQNYLVVSSVHGIRWWPLSGIGQDTEGLASSGGPGNGLWNQRPPCELWPSHGLMGHSRASDRLSEPCSSPLELRMVMPTLRIKSNWVVSGTVMAGLTGSGWHRCPDLGGRADGAAASASEAWWLDTSGDGGLIPDQGSQVSCWHRCLCASANLCLVAPALRQRQGRGHVGDLVLVAESLPLHEDDHPHHHDAPLVLSGERTPVPSPPAGLKFK